MYASARDRSKQLRVVIDAVRTPSAQFKDRRFLTACLLGACWGWVRPWEKLWNPSDIVRAPGDIRAILRTPIVLDSDLNFGSYLGSEGELISYSSFVSKEVKEAISSKQWAWISYAERADEIDMRGLDVQGVLVPRQGVQGRPRRIGVKNGVIDFVDKDADNDATGILSSDGRAAYSAIRNTLFMADKSLGDSVVMYDVAAGVRWQPG